MVVSNVQFNIWYKVLKYNNDWSYQVRMEFGFKDSGHKLEELLVECGVYTYKFENEARIEAKRIGKQFKEYFENGIGDILTKALEDQLNEKTS